MNEELVSVITIALWWNINILSVGSLPAIGIHQLSSSLCTYTNTEFEEMKYYNPQFQKKLRFCINV